jgi:hypothetical protein
VIADKVFVEMTGRKPTVARPIEPFDLVLAINRDPSARYPAEPPVQQPGIPSLFVGMASAAERSFADAQQLRRFDLIEFARFIAIQNTPEFDYTHTLVGFRPAHPGSPKNPVSPDRSCATDTSSGLSCALPHTSLW